MSNNCDEDVQRIKKKLEKMMKTEDVDVSSSIDMLNCLKNLPINLQILQNTRIGVVVNNLRKATNSEELGTLAKNLLKSWKKLVSGESTTNNLNNNPVSPNSNSNFDDRENSNSTKSPQQIIQTTPPRLQQQTSIVSNISRQTSLESTSSLINNFNNNTKINNNNNSGNQLTKTNSANGLTQNNSSNQLSSDKKSSSLPASSSSSSSSSSKSTYKPNYTKTVSYTDTRDQIRVKSRELLEQALNLTEQIDANIPLYDAHAIACRCEDVIYNEFKNTDQKYRNRIRSRIANLKDPKNPKLKENVLIGLITPERLAVMTAEEMASDELKQLREKFTKEAINDHQMATAPVAKSSLLKCGKCKKSNCGYREMQTRSADEPMTVFAFCNDCGHRWKFG